VINDIVSFCKAKFRILAVSLPHLYICF